MKSSQDKLLLIYGVFYFLYVLIMFGHYLNYKLVGIYEYIARHIVSSIERSNDYGQPILLCRPVIN